MLSTHKRDRLTILRKAVAPQRAELQRLAASMTPQTKAAFLEAIRRTSGAMVMARVQEALERGDLRAVEAAIPWENLEYELAAVAPVFRQTYERSAVLALQHLPKEVALNLRFDLLNPRAVDYIRRHTADMVTGVLDSSRQAIRQVMLRAFEEGMHPYESARHIRSLIGLTERQAGAVDRYYQGLIRQGATKGKAEELARIYADRQLDYRAASIARSETALASQSGKHEMWRQAADAGYINPATARRIWITAGDSRVCEWCQTLEGKEVGLEQEFVAEVTTATGLYRPETTLYPPIHPQCRCDVALVL